MAMASRTPFVAGATRMGLAFQPAAGHEHADAAFDAAVAQAGTRGDVLVLSGSAEQAATYKRLGFAVRAERVLLDLRPGAGRT